MFAFTKTCACGRRFRTLNPLRARCDRCEEDAWLDAFVPLTSVSEGMREFYVDILAQDGIPAVLKTTALSRYGSVAVVNLWVRRRDLEAAGSLLQPPDDDASSPPLLQKRQG